MTVERISTAWVVSDIVDGVLEHRQYYSLYQAGSYGRVPGRSSRPTSRQSIRVTGYAVASIPAIVPMKGESNETCNREYCCGFRSVGGVYGMYVDGQDGQ